MFKRFFKNLFGSNDRTKNENHKSNLPFVFGQYSADPERDLSGLPLNPHTLYKLYGNNSDISDCVDGNAEDTFSRGFEWVDPNDEEKEINEMLTTELNFIFGVSNFSRITYSWNKLKFQVSRDLDVAGVAFAYIVRNIARTRILGFKMIDPRTMAIVSDRHGVIHKFIQRANNATAIVFDESEIIYFTNHINLRNEIFGMSPIESLFWDAKSDIAAMLSNYYFFKNEAKPSNLFILDDDFKDMDEAKQKQLLDQIKDQFSNPENHHKSAVMSMIKEVVQLTLSPKDMEFLNQRVFTRRKIRAKYRRPEFLDGYTESVNNNNGEELRREYWDNIDNRNQRITETFNRDFIGRIPALAGKVSMKALPQKFEKQVKEQKDTAQKELERGVITRREYKQINGMEITDADEKDPNYDEHIFYGGSSAVFSEDIGVDPQPAENTNNQSNDANL